MPYKKGYCKIITSHCFFYSEHGSSNEQNTKTEKTRSIWTMMLMFFSDLQIIDLRKSASEASLVGQKCSFFAPQCRLGDI